MSDPSSQGGLAVRTQLLEAALSTFATHGFEGSTMALIADSAGLPLETAFAHYPSKHAFALALYQGLVADTQSVVADLPQGPVAQRFRTLMEAKLARLDTQRSAMRALIAAAVDAKGPVGVLSAATASIRAKMSGAIHAAVVGATEFAGASDPPAQLAHISSALYGVHLAIVLLWTQDDDGRMARGALDLCCAGLQATAPFLAFPMVSEHLGKLQQVFGDRLSPVVSADVESRARWILARLMRHRRLLSEDEGAASSAANEEELSPHLPLVRAALVSGQPLTLVLPAFPAKSPSPHKVLGKVPDMAERVALRSLATLAEELGEAHPAGISLLLCSDGLVFADVVGVADVDVAAYGEEIDALLVGLPRLRRFDLAHAFGPASPAEARQRLNAGWGESESELLALARTSRSVGALLDGLHRFLFEDAVALAPPGVSRTKLRNEARPRAVEVLRRSRAWGRLLATFFPDALRLSIHPQPRVSEKIGVHLLPTTDVWLTPWHGVALLEQDRFRLVKRAEAEAWGAVPVSVDGRPSHFVLAGGPQGRV